MFVGWLLEVLEIGQEGHRFVDHQGREAHGVQRDEACSSGVVVVHRPDRERIDAPEQGAAKEQESCDGQLHGGVGPCDQCLARCLW